MKILVTGGAGFIASQISDTYIREGHDVHILDNLSTGFEKNINSKAQFIKLDISSSAILDLFKRKSLML